MYIARRKRVIKLPDREIDLGDFYLTDFVQPSSYAAEQVMWEGWDRLTEFHKEDPEAFAELVNRIGLYNMYVKEIWNVVNIKIKYRYDDPVFQTPDFWLTNNEVYKQGRGDCEDTCFLTLSAVLRVKRLWEAFDDVAKGAVTYGCIGYYIDPVTRDAYGHGFVIHSTDRIAGGRWLWVETTFEDAVPQSIWYLADFDVLLPVYFFTDRECYRIDRDYGKLGLSEDYVERYKDLIDAMIQYVETGKWLKVKWMHKSRRVPELTEKIYIS